MMFRKTWVYGIRLLLAAVVALPFAAAAQPTPTVPQPAQPDANDCLYVNFSDVIVVGTVTDIKTVTGAFPGGLPIKGCIGRLATIRVDKVLKGQASGQLTAEMMISKPPYVSSVTDMQANDQGVFQLKWDTFTADNQPIYTMVHNSPVATADKIAKYLQMLPTMTITSVSGPFCFGKRTRITFKIHNPTGIPIHVDGFGGVECRLFMTQIQDKDVPNRINAFEVPDTHNGANTNTTTTPGTTTDPTRQVGPKGGVVIDPGKAIPGSADFAQTIKATSDLEYAVTVTCLEPDGWQVFQDQSFFLMAAAIRVSVAITPDPKDRTYIQVNSPWHEALVGFPTPEFPPKGDK